MKKILFLSASVLAFGSAIAQPVSVSIGVNAPGVYGQINIGSPMPETALVVPQAIVAGPVVVGASPLYLYVPEAHRRDWRHHCAQYHACGRPVYFVREDWVNDRYAHEHPGWKRGDPVMRHEEHGAPRRDERAAPAHEQRGHDEHRGDQRQ